MAASRTAVPTLARRECRRRARRWTRRGATGVALRCATVAVVLHHFALVAAGVALLDAALLAASTLAPSGLERVLAAAVIATAGAVAEALGLGLAGLGSSTIALALAAGVTSGAARAWLPRPALSPLDEFAEAVATAPTAARVAVGAGGGVLAVLAVFFLIHPSLGIDGVSYHLPEIVSWIHGGSPGAEIQPSEDFPTAAYPLTNEVLLAWAIGLSRSFVPVALWTPILLGLFAVAMWLGLRRLGVAAIVIALAILAVVLSPALTRGFNGPKNDLAAITWMAATAALAVAAVERPRLLAVAVLAAGLSIGTKTTTAPVLMLVLSAAALAAWRSRGTQAQRAPRSLLLAALAGAAVVGGVWYVRNILVHGSPFWPLIGTSWGDDVPRAIARLDVSFFERPRATLQGRTNEYLGAIAGGLVLLVAGILAVLLDRGRAVLAASATALIAAFVWASGPFTGLTDDPVVDLSLSTLRYLLPAFVAGAAALALASRAPGVRGRVAVALLGLAALWSAGQTARLGYPAVPGVGAVLSGALLGTGAGALAGWVATRGTFLVRAATAAVVAVGALGLAASASGYVKRHAQTNATFAAPVVRWFADRPDFRDGSAPISTAPQSIGPLAGDRLQHDVELIPGDASCASVRARARRGFVVIRVLPARIRSYLVPYTAADCLVRERTIFAGGGLLVYHFDVTATPAEDQLGP